jgi:hypothetical protein
MPQNRPCPYCNNIIQIPDAPQNAVNVNAQVVGVQRSFSSLGHPLMVDCRMCKRRYEYFDIEDFSWVKGMLKLSEEVLEGLKSFDTGDEPLDLIFDHIIGITRPEKNHMHIILQVGDSRIALSCSEEKKCIRGIGLYKVYENV